MRWVRSGELDNAPVMHGMWGELSDRVRRLLRQSGQQVDASAARLQEFLAALQASPSGVILLGVDGSIEWCNQMGSEQFGIDPDRDLQQSIGNLVRNPAFAAYYASGQYDHAVVMPGRANTSSRPVRLSVQLHPYGEGRKLLLARDVTALEQADAMRRDFVANVSHEIRTPLTVLTGFVETLQTLPLPPQDSDRYLGLMAQQCSRMQSVVSDLLTLSRLEGSPLPAMMEWTPLRVLMQHCEQEGRALSELLTQRLESRQSLHFELPDGAWDIAGSHTELQSALSNLVSNAVRYTPAGGSITVAWQPWPDGTAEFSVTDTGPGIAPEHLPRLTERFYRVDRSRSRETGGTGLGLAIVKHVLQRHGSSLSIDSTLGKGSRFSVLFPANRLRRSNLQK